MHKDKLCQTSKKFHSWECNIPVKVGTSNEVVVKASICPRVSDTDDILKAVLDVKAHISKSLLKRLCNNGFECGITVETKVLDSHTQRNVGSTQFHSHSVSMDDGKVTFRQDLALCDEVKESRSDSVTVVITVIFTTATPKKQYDISEHNDFEVIDTVD